MSHYKRTSEDRAERLLALGRVFPNIDLDTQARLSGTRPHDILDGFAAAWSATRWLSGRHVQLGGDLDSRGLRMEMIA